MIKVHCFVSCVCEVINKAEGVDHRPYYFGVWDSDFFIENHVLHYHSPNTNHEFFKDWYKTLYGIELVKWYDPTKSVQENQLHLCDLVEHKKEYEQIMVMIDLSYLPERENKFHTKPFPHYVMVEKMDDEESWFMWDPDFRWEGKVSKERILESMEEPTVGGGYIFSTEQLVPPTELTVEAYFATCMKLDTYPMTEAVQKIIHNYVDSESETSRPSLKDSLRHLPVLAIRKYAYEHAYAYFWERLGFDEDWFETWCDKIELLVKGYTLIQYKAMKYDRMPSESLLTEIDQIIHNQFHLESQIKHGLMNCFHQWKESQQSVQEEVMVK
ncbi:Petrobactin biosynthesis protein AsbE [Bacillus coahuilensis p1.1.43]|uniref:Petrobactin biosynthesis protein AsbE n=1 Tax=Bacillus coahuilensis p1.1.43 TaxID=1150625 RepID=A0A147K7N1_9BACI|nr:DUF6005 family protein [Bacillus coahuilensis]KUP06132.1 Petrobactin biosynthesis protein AsbE [Bacillus coahuilensis p1.1.43]